MLSRLLTTATVRVQPQAELSTRCLINTRSSTNRMGTVVAAYSTSHNRTPSTISTTTSSSPSTAVSSLHSCCATSPIRLLTTISSLHAAPSKPTASSSASHTSKSGGAASCTPFQPATTRPVEDASVTDAGASVTTKPTNILNTPLPTAASNGTSEGGKARFPLSGSESHFDLVVIGSGPSGQKCAIDAAKKGKRVCVIDKQGMFGGVCIHTGTIPSKTFREAILHLTAHNQRGFGGEVLARGPNLSREVLDRVQKVEQWETETILKQLHRNKVMTIQGTARFVDPHHVEVVSENDPATSTWGNPQGHTLLGSLGGATSGSPVTVAGSGGVVEPLNRHIIRGDKFLIACGSKPARNPTYPWESPLVFDSDAILKNHSWGEIKNLIVVGSGVIALEYASMFSTLPNCKVTILDERTSFLDFIDAEVIDTLKYVMRRKGATFLLGERVQKVTILNNGTQVRVDLDSGKDVIGDALFYAVGRQAESGALGLETAQVETAKRGLIPVNEYFQTSQQHIYAAGDVIGFPALASTAMEQGRLCSQHMFGTARPMKPVFPYGIYTIPEISVVGHSEQELTKLRIPYKTGVAKYEETAKGQMMGGPHIDGFLKIMFCPTSHRLLGASAIGENATEIIHIGQSVMSLNGTIEYFRDSVFNFPTYAELFRVAALDGLNKIAATQSATDKFNADASNSTGTPTV